MSNKRAPAAITIKPPKLDFGGLNAAYEWLPADKPLGFRMAFSWYAENAVALLHGDPLDTDRQRAYDRAVKAKVLGDGGQTEGEQLQAWTTALHLYEQKVWPAKPLPKVDEALTAQPGKRVAAAKAVLANLNAAFSGHLAYTLGTGADREWGEGTVSVSAAELERMAAQSPLKTALSEVLAVAKAVSIVTEDGKRRLDGALFMANLPRVLESVNAWAEKQDRLTKAVGKTTKVTRIPKTAARSASNSTNFLPNGAVITIVKDHGLKGKRAECMNLLKTGMTVKEFREALSRNGFNSGYVKWTLDEAMKSGCVTVTP